ncbi:MAG: hypothetical protein EOL93_00710 [Epsilonproteobacteria bacterium]|nr:hypothetical protein [Campylobacterota bacterium]
MDKEWCLSANGYFAGQINHHYPLVDGVVNNIELDGFSLINLEPKKLLNGFIYYRYLLLKSDNSIALLDSNLEEITSTQIAYTRFADEVAIEAKVENKKFYFRTNYGAYYSKTFAYTIDTMMLSSKTTSLGVGINAMSGSVVSAKHTLAGVEREARYISSEKKESSGTVSVPKAYSTMLGITITVGGTENAPMVINGETAFKPLTAFFKDTNNYKKKWGGWVGSGQLGQTVETPPRYSWQATFPSKPSILAEKAPYKINTAFSEKGVVMSMSFGNSETPISELDISEDSKSTTVFEDEFSSMKEYTKKYLLFAGQRNLLITNRGGVKSSLIPVRNYIADVIPLQDVGGVYVHAPLPIDVEPIPAS